MCSHGHPEQSEQEAGKEFSASSDNYVFTRTSMQNRSEQEAGEEFSASSGNYVFTWTSRTEVDMSQGRILC